MYKLIFLALAIAASAVAEPEAEAEADPQYLYYASAAPSVPYVSYVAPTTTYATYQPTTEYTSYQPSTYAADPFIWDKLNHQTSGTFLPGIFGWERGHNHFKHFLKKPHRIRHLPGHRRYGHDFRPPRGGADGNKFEKYKKREAEAEPDAEADPQYLMSPTTYYTYQPSVVPTYSSAAYVPTTYAAAADPFIWEKLNHQTSGTFLPGIFGWERGHNHFKHFLKKPHRIRHLPGHRRYGHDFRPPRGGADGNKFEKYKKREAEAEPEADPQYLVSPTTYYTHQPSVVMTYSAEPTATTAYVPTTYAASADPFFFDNFSHQSKGTFLPRVFGWERGHNHFKHFLKKPHRIRHLPGHRRYGHDFRPPRGGADGNKFEKY